MHLISKLTTSDSEPIAVFQVTVYSVALSLINIMIITEDTHTILLLFALFAITCKQDWSLQLKYSLSV